jgi:hypothetical protein
MRFALGDSGCRDDERRLPDSTDDAPDFARREPLEVQFIALPRQGSGEHGGGSRRDHTATLGKATHTASGL